MKVPRSAILHKITSPSSFSASEVQKEDMNAQGRKLRRQ